MKRFNLFQLWQRNKNMENITNTKGANLLTLIQVFQAIGKEVSNDKIIGLKVGIQGEMIGLYKEK